MSRECKKIKSVMNTSRFEDSRVGNHFLPNGFNFTAEINEQICVNEGKVTEGFGYWIGRRRSEKCAVMNGIEN